MRANTLIMLLIAVVFGSIAVFLANIWLNNQSRLAGTVATPAPAETATIVVASVDLGFGETLVAEKLREIAWPKGSIPEGSYATVAELTADRRVALSPIGPNEAVLKWKISGPGARASLSAVVTEGMRAVAIRINDVIGVGGFLLPGDRVDVLYTRGGNEGSSTDILIQNVRILAVNQISDEKKTDPVVANVVTVEVTTTDAQKIALAQTTGSLSLTLRSAGSLDQAPAQRIVEQELVSSKSVYEAEFNARKIAQEALDARLKGLESNLTNVSRRVDETDSSKAKLAEKLVGIEQSFKSEIANAGATNMTLKAQLVALEEIVRQTAKATGQGEEALRKKLAALEAAIRQASLSTGKGEDAALRAKLAEFERSLRQLAASPGVIVEPASDTVTVAEPLTVTVGVTRGMARQSYEVSPDSVRQ